MNEDVEAEQWAWEAFATAHPHEAFATWPDRFWDFFHAQAPNITREQMAALLLTTEETTTLNTRTAGR